MGGLMQLSWEAARTRRVNEISDPGTHEGLNEGAKEGEIGEQGNCGRHLGRGSLNAAWRGTWAPEGRGRKDASGGQRQVKPGDGGDGVVRVGGCVCGPAHHPPARGPCTYLVAALRPQLLPVAKLPGQPHDSTVCRRRPNCC